MPSAPILSVDASPVPFDDDAQGFADIWDQHIRDGRGLDLRAAAKLMDAGWSEVEVCRLADLARDAVESSPWQGGAPRAATAQRQWRVAKGLADWARTVLHPAGCGVDEAFGWLALAAGAESEQNRAAVLRAWTGRRIFPTARVRGLRAVLPGEVAPLAWAAGLSTVEAAAGYATGKVREDGLWLLAGLRGYRQPTCLAGVRF